MDKEVASFGVNPLHSQHIGRNSTVQPGSDQANFQGGATIKGTLARQKKLGPPLKKNLFWGENTFVNLCVLKIWYFQEIQGVFSILNSLIVYV